MRNPETHTETILLSTDLYDLSMLEEMDDNGYLLEILAILLYESPADLKEMKDALQAGKTEIVCKKAHKLKSTAGVIQAERLTALLADIEDSGKKGSIANELNRRIEDAAFEYNRIEKSLKIYIMHTLK